MKTNDRLQNEINEEIIMEIGVHCAYEKYCGGLTLEQIFTTDSVYVAAYHCASGFQHRKDTRAFMDSAWVNSRILCQKVLEDRFKPSYYPTKHIVERGKPREIRPPKFECKVVQKVLCNYLMRRLLEPRMINTNFASIKGKGTEKLYRAVLKGVNQNTENKQAVIVTTDFSGFFGSISNNDLEAMFGKLIRDQRVVKLIRMFCPEDFGQSLGNELSQVPASYFPSSIDHYFKDKMGRKDFYRYMDDVLTIAPDESTADSDIEIIKEKASLIKLNLKNEKIKKIPIGENFTYCKERYIFNLEKRYYYRLINPNIPRTESRKLSAFKIKVQKGKMTANDVTAQYNGVIGMIKSRPNTKKIVKRLEIKYKAAIAAPEQGKKAQNTK